MTPTSDTTASTTIDLCVVGLGYIGLPTAALAASTGLRVVGVDIDAAIVESVNAGIPHFPEPALSALVGTAVASGQLTAQTTPVPARTFLIAVPTPFLENKAPDLRMVEAAGAAIAPHLTSGCLVILESTSPPRTTTQILAPILAQGSGLTPGVDFHLAYCPERVLPGRLLEELRANDRILGGTTPEASAAAAGFYGRFVSGQLLISDATTAETVKLVENAYRDVNIAFANEVSLIAAHLGVDPFQVIALANHHPRVRILEPGIGVGGHCIGVDPWFLVDAAPTDANLIRTARRVNEYKTEWVTTQILAMADRVSPSTTLGFLGLTYKPDVADLRESPALHIAQRCTDERPGTVLVHDPLAVVPTSLVGASLEEVLQQDLVVILVKHQVYRDLPVSAWTRPILDLVGLLRDPGV
ncbi:MAG: UDP-N-acetyl-D-mannosamine dehydrogenase [bacterium]|nr:UDP-N-acetyl-D-mannosamine dehydrogenase [bacterium]